MKKTKNAWKSNDLEPTKRELELNIRTESSWELDKCKGEEWGEGEWGRGSLPPNEKVDLFFKISLSASLVMQRLELEPTTLTWSWMETN